MTDVAQDAALDARPLARPDTNLFGQTRRPKERLDRVDGRLLLCTGPCGGIVDVFEIPRGYIDPENYVCGDCQETV